MTYTLARNIIIYSELNKVLSSFNSAGIKTILLAGAALGATVYPSIAERPMGDIDLLIRPVDKQRIGELLGDLGFSLETARSDEAHYSKTIHSFCLHIDCHTGLKHYLDDNALQSVWQRARPAICSPLYQEGKGVCNFLTLSPEDTLIYTAVDAAVYHMQITPTFLNDITLIIKYYQKDLNWAQIITRIKQYRLEVPLYYVFIADNNNNAGIPDEVIHTIKPPKRKLLEGLIYKIIFTKRMELDDDISRILRFLTRPSARLELLLNSFVPASSFIKQRYKLNSRMISYLYYPIRFLNLIWRVSEAVFFLLHCAFGHAYGRSAVVDRSAVGGNKSLYQLCSATVNINHQTND